MTKLKIAVIGASGFIGRHVVTELLKYDVDIVATYYSSKSKLISPSKVHWLNFDIGKSSDNIFSELGKPDVLIHLTWSGLPNYNSPHHYETELPNQYDFLRKMILGGLKSVVIAGTCFEYGMQSGPLSADMETEPNNSYGFAKDVLRKQLEYLQLKYEFKITWARLFYMYGEGQSEASLLPQLQKAVLNNKKKFKMSGGEQLRDYLPVTEVAKQLVLLAQQPKNIGVVNVCSGEPKSVRCLVEQWIEENNWNIELELGYYAYPDYEPMAFWGVTNKEKF
jgi:dTDP-6-deoxy-L-talose 4-dehydrogenase (NAD+)